MMKIARSRATVTYRILESDEEHTDPYGQTRIARKGEVEIVDGFHVPFFLSARRFKAEYEPA